MSEELKLLPCPACCGEGLLYCGSNGRFHIPCKACNMTGPRAVNPDLARTAWNALPRALTWTTEPPAIGWNWWRLGTEWLPVARYVHSDGSIDNELLGRTWDKIGGQWCPIPIPKEPTP